MNPETQTLIERLRADYAHALPVDSAVDLQAIELGARRRKRDRNRNVALAGCGLAAAVALGIGLFPNSDSGSEVSSRPSLLVESLDFFPSTSAADWARNADYVVVVKVVAEQSTRSHGASLARSVDLEVQRELWVRAEGPARPLLSTLSLGTPGWVVEGNDKVPVAYPATPRLEIGHSYVIAVTWIPRACSSGDAPSAGHWIALGSHAILPADGDRVGYGESEGRAVQGDRDQVLPDSLEGQLLGKPVSQVVAELDAQPSSPRSNIFPKPTC